ncbi:DNA topoisomerase 2 [Entomophthora muscae]|uniref:DNA topoisomerase 2 n=1 Tax=Entomophthora muscae TaxID=34485 RepID=A0ACC2T5M6_9FUNG|nr:DNA topoisomerase 2 [Entomophthora muscae]
MSDSEASFVSDNAESGSDYMPEPKKIKTGSKAAPKKPAAKPKAPPKAKKASASKSKEASPEAMEVESDGGADSPAVEEGGEGQPKLASIFNTTPKKSGGKKTIEQIYQKKSQLEHILLRPDTYIGSVEMNTQRLWIYNDETDSLQEKDIQIVPGLFKIFDEILVNAADNKIRDPTMTKIKVNIDPENNTISVYNNGRGIPVEIHKEEKVFVPELIFGHLLTSSNYDDSEKKVVGGRNGYGAKLCNIFSTEFIVETADKKTDKKYYQKFTNNMSVIGKPKVTSFTKGEEFTRITFKPDLNKFHMDRLDADIVGLLKRRVYDLCGTVKGVSVFLNDNKLKLSGFKDYIQMYLKSAPGPDDEDLTKKLVFDKIGDRWEIGFVPSGSGQLQQVSFVNSISTSKGGTHVNHVVDAMLKPIQEALEKKKIKNKTPPGVIKGNMWIFVNSLIDNPSFDSQTKEFMTLKPSSFGSRCELPDKFKASVVKSGIIAMLESFATAKDSRAMNKALDSSKSGRVSGIPKLDDANRAGTKDSHKCTLILTEGDSAKNLAMAGLTKVGRDYFGVFPLRGKPLNVRDAPAKQIAENKELVNISKILGLNSKQEYENASKLRYGHIMIMADQDHDGSHIKGLLINFFDHFYPSLLTVPDFMQEFITPIVKATPKSLKGSGVISFFTVPEYNEWCEKQNMLAKNYTIKYYKGLATSDRKEGIEYFSNLKRHNIKFEPIKPEERKLIDLAFNKKKADARKEWLREFKVGTFIDQNVEKITYSDFINKELIQFSMADNIRSIPCVIDGFKPGQRKIIYGCFKIPDKETKVAQLIGIISAKTAYHHGEISLSSTIIGLAQDFVGSNNVNLLAPIGQFGSRAQGGKDAGAARYINTRLKPITRILFNKDDAPLLEYQDDDGKKVEPKHFVPVVPTLLLNGCDGIGTGWSTNIPNFNPVEVVENLRRCMNKEPLVPMHPWYLGFRGDIEPAGPHRYKVRGRITKVDDTTLEISELPIGVWTGSYDEKMEDWRLNSDMIDDYQKHHTDLTVKYTVQVSEASMAKLEAGDMYASFKLVDSITTSNMVCFDESGRIKRYNSPEEILNDFFLVRLKFYIDRRQHMIKELKLQLNKLSNKARFILAVVDQDIILRNVPHAKIVEKLIEMKFDPIGPEKSTKKRNDSDDEEEKEEDSSNIVSTGNQFNYLLDMKLSSLTRENVAKIARERDAKHEELNVLMAKSHLDLWNTDLDAFLEEWDKVVKENDEARNQSLTEGSSSANKRGKKVASKPRAKKEDTKSGKALSRSNSSTKPKVELPSDETATAKPAKPIPRANSVTKPKPVKIDSDSDDLFSGSLSQRTGIKPPSVAKPKVAPKRKKIQLSESEEEFAEPIEVPTKTQPRPRREAVSKAKYVDTIELSSEEDAASEEEQASEFEVESE